MYLYDGEMILNMTYLTASVRSVFLDRIIRYFEIDGTLKTFWMLS